MIIVKLIGGLGNQMFQYALGRHLAEKNSDILKLDIFEFKTYKLRRYGLGCFHIQENMATKKEIEDIQKPSALLKEKDFGYDPEVLEKKGDLYIQGYWQSEKYFIDIRDILLREFTVKYKQGYRSKKISGQILSTTSVSLHVRRGDYVHNPIFNKVHGVCGINYYMSAIKYIAERIENPHFFIFSDDPRWAKSNLDIKFPNTVIKHNSKRGYEDLRLMSQCKHDIIANSSFSWWAAWLNANPDKIVIAPKEWLKDKSRNTKDLLPGAWIRL